MFHVATSQGVLRWTSERGRLEPVGLDGIPIWCVASTDGYMAGVGRGSTIWERCNGSWSVSQLGLDVRAVSLAARSDQVWVGTYPPRIYGKRIGERRWRLLAALDRDPISDGFRAPHGGQPAARSLAPLSSEELFCGIHVGGVLRSRDRGVAWEPAASGLEEDVHEVAAAGGRVYAATADGVYLSEDRGESWERRCEGLDNLYCRAVAVHPGDPDLVLASGAPGPPPTWGDGGPRFALFRTRDAGRRWQRVSAGLPGTLPDILDTGCLTFSSTAPDTVAFAVGSRLFLSEDAGATWVDGPDAGEPIRSLC